MERNRIYKWEYEQEMNDHARSELFWALLEHLGLAVYSVEYDGCSPEYEFVKDE